jgi:hypothetical protein
MKAGYLYVMNTQPFYCKLRVMDKCDRRCLCFEQV